MCDVHNMARLQAIRDRARAKRKRGPAMLCPLPQVFFYSLSRQFIYEANRWIFQSIVAASILCRTARLLKSVSMQFSASGLRQPDLNLNERSCKCGNNSLVGVWWQKDGSCFARTRQSLPIAIACPHFELCVAQVFPSAASGPFLVSASDSPCCLHLSLWPLLLATVVLSFPVMLLPTNPETPPVRLWFWRPGEPKVFLQV